MYRLFDEKRRNQIAAVAEAAETLAESRKTLARNTEEVKQRIAETRLLLEQSKQPETIDKVSTTGNVQQATTTDQSESTAPSTLKPNCFIDPQYIRSLFEPNGRANKVAH